MECILCEVIKLPSEFPPENVTEKCRHPPIACLRCTVSSIENLSQCPHPECQHTVQLSDEKPQLFQALLRELFKEYETNDEDADEEAFDTQEHPVLAKGILTVALLTGESFAVPFDPEMEVLELKRRIHEQLNHPVDKQKLIYKEVELKDYEGDKRCKLSDFRCKPNSTLSLVIMLFAVPDKFNHVIFDLYWRFPSTGLDFLDASCLMYNGSVYTDCADFSNNNPNAAVCHSGDMIDDKSKTGHHTISIKLKELPASMTHLFFTLSAWDSPDISRYPNPSLKFYEAENPTKDLCQTTFTHARNSEAVIMCSLSRKGNGQWKIFSFGKLSAGNAANYKPLLESIDELFTQAFYAL
ncbi:uncharacterized protein LOC128548049 isoform X1 [Mercenaria mercenaria]|uniref:uncharacterized protein LOC128548049 isoform X1 n=1 Tax=Mercenaria mercenaria TaxID=6596 RepID=UPI00234ECFAC|nr:uncharacterized protein LOC128548049 isoform X1 [Mercenaria mercenaria]